MNLMDTFNTQSEEKSKLVRKIISLDAAVNKLALRDSELSAIIATEISKVKREYNVKLSTLESKIEILEGQLKNKNNIWEQLYP